ncbi:TPA: hypothetical protein PNM84_001334 [Listeria monocytogenes]|nr:hypothetical protein [Listeria monocytogenes]HAA9071013.1 hypothetical protein [Listeria monocytogenes]HDI4828566.1 hypothetical protein [Listeria monocytogenes]HDM9928147.1 hypothetical protein [Listeria monocytogenes]
MRVKVAPNDTQSMSQDGDAILRSLQNKNLPMVDLMVRESLQNSLDATLPGEQVTTVDFKIGKFETEIFAPHLERIDERLIEKFSGEQLVLSVSDKHTSGLTGDFRTDETKILDDSNFQKLVFGIGKNQDQDGAGGSWGLGKTSYFRMGAGIVLYYTRIAIDSGFEERLIASLIESPKEDDRLFSENARGIAWWGEFDESGEKIFPITNHEKIKDILDIFGLSNYFDNETGTTIIVPFVKPIEIEGHDTDVENFPWEFDYESAIKMAIQRWYSPRLWNAEYSSILGNSQLQCSVNSEGIHPDINMEPTFKIFQDLYTSALMGESKSSNITVEKVILPQNAMKETGKEAGRIAFCEVSRELLKMDEPNNKRSGLAYLGVKDKRKIERNISKVIAYSRKPGMIVEYSVDGDWTPNGLIQKEDHLLFGFFVPNSNGILLDKFHSLGYETLEQYLRATENADHANWIDDAGIGIIRRMKSYTSRVISDSFQDLSGNEYSTATSALSRKFGAMLMPPKNFGKTSAKKVSEDKLKRDVDSRNRISDISITSSVPIDEQNVEISFKAFIKKSSKSIIFIQVLTQDQKMNKEAWDNAMGSIVQFPIEIESVFLNSIDGEVINSFADNYCSADLDIGFNKNNPEIIEIKSKVPSGLEIEGVIRLKILSNQYLPSIAIRSDIKENEGDK